MKNQKEKRGDRAAKRRIQRSAKYSDMVSDLVHNGLSQEAAEWKALQTLTKRKK